MAFGAQPLSYNGVQTGLDRCSVVRAHHKICRDGIRITIPVGGMVTDTEAKRLAWGILNDLAPDETIAVPEVVTYKEAQRLAVMRVVEAEPAPINAIASALSWGRRMTERRIHELIKDGRMVRLSYSGHDVRFGLVRNR